VLMGEGVQTNKEKERGTKNRFAHHKPCANGAPIYGALRNFIRAASEPCSKERRFAGENEVKRQLHPHRGVDKAMAGGWGRGGGGESQGSWWRRGEGKGEGCGREIRGVGWRKGGEGEGAWGEVSRVWDGGDPLKITRAGEGRDGSGKEAEELCTKGLVGSRAEGGSREDGGGRVRDEAERWE
jgi:hypothetical protein